MVRRCCALLVLLCCCIGCLGPTPALAATGQVQQGYRARAFNADITVQEDGSLLVTETMVIHFAGGPFTSFTRDLTSNKGGRVTLEQASLQDDPFNGRSETSITRMRNSSRIVWHFPEISNRDLTFVLHYQASGVVQQASDSDLLQWFAIPAEHDYAIDSSTITVHYPISARLLRTPDAAGVLGTSVSTGPWQVVFVTDDLSAYTSMEIDIEFALGSVVPQSAAYQLQRRVLPYLVVPCLLLGLLIILLGWLWLAHRARRYRQALPEGVQPWQSVKQSPDDLAPALAGLLASSDAERVGWHHVQATLLDLLNRGILVFREIESTYQWRTSAGRQQKLVCLSEPDELLPHERALLHILFKGPDVVGHTLPSYSLKAVYQAQATRFRLTVQAYVQGQGWLDARRMHEQRRLRWMMRGLFVLGLLHFVVTGILMESVTEYYWCLLFPGLGWLILAGIAKYYWRSFSVVKDEWWFKAWQWRQFALYLRECSFNPLLAKHTGPEMALAYLPYAASLGLADNWLRMFVLPTTGSVPPWFTISSSDPALWRPAFERTMYAAGFLVPKDKRTASYSAYR